MATRKFGSSSAVLTAVASVVLAGLAAFGCSSDSNNTPSKPPVVIGDGGDSGTAGGSGNGGSGAGGSGQGGGGTTSTGGGGGSNGGSAGSGGTGTGATDGGTGGSPVEGGTGGAPPCDPNVTGSNPPGCFQCAATTHEQFLNHCTDSQCSAFDATRLPNPLPSPTW